MLPGNGIVRYILPYELLQIVLQIGIVAMDQSPFYSRRQAGTVFIIGQITCLQVLYEIWYPSDIEAHSQSTASKGFYNYLPE
jgi:hypothetical protein